MGFEFELKYQATAAVQEAIRNAYPGQWETLCMETTYYDTPTGALSDRWYTLRRRMENGIAVCTIKTPVDEIGRGEWEVRENEIHRAIPELCKLGAPEDLLALTKDGVIAVCGARFTRQALKVSFGSSVLELALDSGILFAGERQEALCEVEAELKEGTREDAMAFGAVLAKAYGLTAEKTGKFRRALALREER